MSSKQTAAPPGGLTPYQPGTEQTRHQNPCRRRLRARVPAQHDAEDELQPAFLNEREVTRKHQSHSARLPIGTVSSTGYVCTIASTLASCNNPKLSGPPCVRPSTDCSVVKRAPPSGARGQLHRGFRSGHSTFDWRVRRKWCENFRRKSSGPSGPTGDER